MGNLGKYMPIIMQFKSFIQRAVIPLLSANELQDIKDCCLNRQVIDKLVYIGIGQYKKNAEQSDEVLYCLCMAIGTIIKEYDWGTEYIQQSGMCALAEKCVIRQ